MNSTTKQNITPELRQWIVAQAQAGHPPEAVLKSMMESGWTEDVAVVALEDTLRGFLADHAKANNLPPPLIVPFLVMTGASAGVALVQAGEVRVPALVSRVS